MWVSQSDRLVLVEFLDAGKFWLVSADQLRFHGELGGFDIRFYAELGNRHPDHGSLSNFRKRFQGEFKKVLLHVLVVVTEMGVARMSTVAVDSTKIRANASKHSALSWEHAKEIETQRKKTGCTLNMDYGVFISGTFDNG